MNKTINNGDVVIKKDGKVLSTEEIEKLGLTVYKPECNTSPRTFKEFVAEFESLLEGFNPNEDDGDFDNIEVSSKVFDDDDDLLEELNKLYTPILITQEIEGDVQGPVMEACSEDNVLLERNIIKFDNATKFAQLVGICALLIARRKNSQKFKVFKKASQIRNAMKIQIQKEEHAAATALARKYLGRIMHSSKSSIARKAAENLHNSNT